MLVKQYDGRQRYIGAERMVYQGQPDMAYVSTSLVERQNLTMRTNIRRFTQRTNGFSKKWENHLSLARHLVRLLQLVPRPPQHPHDSGDGRRADALRLRLRVDGRAEPLRAFQQFSQRQA